MTQDLFRHLRLHTAHLQEVDMQLTENFTLAELTKSQTAERKGIPNKPTKLQEQSLKLIAEKILQPVSNDADDRLSTLSEVQKDHSMGVELLEMQLLTLKYQVYQTWNLLNGLVKTLILTS